MMGENGTCSRLEPPLMQNPIIFPNPNYIPFPYATQPIYCRNPNPLRLLPPRGVTLPEGATQLHVNDNGNKGPKKAKGVQLLWCEVCNISCNSKVVYDKHILGKKHLKKVEKLNNPATAMPAPVVASACINPTTAMPAPVVASASTNPTTAMPAPVVASASTPPIIFGAMPAPIFASASTPPVITNVHPVTPLIGPQENPDKVPSSKSALKSKRRKLAALEDMESKRRKVLDGGAPAEAVRTCICCNVVCNSETAFNFHLAGQKHAATMKKYAAAMAGISFIAGSK